MLSDREQQIYIAGIQFGYKESENGNSILTAIENAKHGLECLNSLISAANDL